MVGGGYGGDPKAKAEPEPDPSSNPQRIPLPVIPAWFYIHREK
jgi:hypothetical protein